MSVDREPLLCEVPMTRRKSKVDGARKGAGRPRLTPGTAHSEAIRSHAYNDEARELTHHGVTLTHEQADDLGSEALGWLGSRLGLSVRETDSGVGCTPS